MLYLKGNSGCKISLIGDMIQKSCEPSYNDRLKLQYQKQLKFKNNF